MEVVGVEEVDGGVFFGVVAEVVVEGVFDLEGVVVLDDLDVGGGFVVVDGGLDGGVVVVGYGDPGVLVEVVGEGWEYVHGSWRCWGGW